MNTGRIIDKPGARPPPLNTIDHIIIYDQP